jgi:hypothetical protein
MVPLSPRRLRVKTVFHGFEVLILLSWLFNLVQNLNGHVKMTSLNPCSVFCAVSSSLYSIITGMQGRAKNRVHVLLCSVVAAIMFPHLHVPSFSTSPLLHGACFKGGGL